MESSAVGQRSLIRRVVLGIVLAETVCMLALALVSIGHEWQARLRAVDVALEGRADSLFGAVQDAEDAGDNVQLDPREMRLPEGDIFAVYDQSGRRLGSSEHAPEALIGLHGEVGTRTRRVGGHRYRVVRRNNLRIIDRAESGGVGLQRPVIIVYATPLNRIWHEVFEGIGFYLGASLLLIVGTTIFMVGLMRRVLQPIRDLASAAAAVSVRRLHFEAPPGALQTKELRPLATTLTGMVTQLRDAFDRQHQFLGDATHELKTALAVVRSSLQVMLLRPRSPAEYEAGLAGAVRDNARAEELVSRMLLMARLEEPAAGVPRSSDLRAAAARCVGKLMPLAAEAGVRLHGPEPDAESGDQASRCLVAVAADDLEVLVGNLVVNAIEHSDPGSAVTVALAVGEVRATLRVTDRGQGIPEQALPHIFERFYRADVSRARVTGGAGLGLSIAKAIAEGGGGSILVRSRLGQGTEMSVILPLLPIPSQGASGMKDAIPSASLSLT